jgi:hypothetical protein
MQAGVALVHLEQLGGEQRRLVAARARADLEDDVALVGRVLRQQHHLQLLLDLRQLVLERVVLDVGELAHLGVGGGVGHHVLEIGELGLHLAQRVHRLDHRPELGILLRQRDDVARVEARIRHHAAELVVAHHHAVEFFGEAHGSPWSCDLRGRASR